MTTEQKAAAYDRALKVTKNMIGAGLVYEDAAIQIFPELYENRGETIKNLIYCLIRDRSDNGKLLEHNGVSVEEALDWIEKQEPVKESTISKHENETCKENDDSLECDDEKIREALIEYFGEQCDMSNWNGVYGYQVYNWLQKQGEPKENATRYKIAEYLKKLILDQSQRCFPMLNYEGRIEEEVDFIINIAKNELKKELKRSEHQKPANHQKSTNKEYTFTAIPRLLEMIQPNERAKSYCQKLIDRLEQEGYSTDANIVRERLLLMNGEDVPMATMDEQKHKEWNEEDSRKIGTLSSIIFDYAFHKDALDENNDLTGDYAELNDWLGELEERFNLQSKQKWSKEDEEMLDGIILRCEKYGYQEQIDWLKSLESRVHSQSEQNWSEKDEKMLDDACIMLDWYRGNNWWTAQYIKDWLKSLKDRVHSKEKPEWNEEDSTKMQRIINFLWCNRKGDTDTIYQQEQDIEWLKSLKNRMRNKEEEDN